MSMTIRKDGVEVADLQQESGRSPRSRKEARPCDGNGSSPSPSHGKRRDPRNRTTEEIQGPQHGKPSRGIAKHLSVAIRVRPRGNREPPVLMARCQRSVGNPIGAHMVNFLNETPIEHHTSRGTVFNL